MAARTNIPIDSEHYRQQLVRDGERRFREWHTAFLKYQQKFLTQLTQVRQQPGTNLRRDSGALRTPLSR